MIPNATKMAPKALALSRSEVDCERRVGMLMVDFRYVDCKCAQWELEPLGGSVLGLCPLLYVYDMGGSLAMRN